MQLPLIQYPKSRIQNPESRNGFTLIELLIVIAIIAILISIGLASYSRAQAQARDGQRKSDLRNIQGALEQYYADFNKYPDAPIGTVENELEGDGPENTNIVYLKEVRTKDPRGNDYIYTGGDQRYCLGSNSMDTDDTTETCDSGSGDESYEYVLTPRD